MIVRSVVALAFVGCLAASCGEDAASRPSGSSTGAAGATSSTAASGSGGAGQGSSTGGSAGAAGTATAGGSGGSTGSGTGGQGTGGQGTGGQGTGGGDASVPVDASGTGGSGTRDGGDASEPSCVPGTGTTDIDANTARDNKTCLVWQKTATCSGAWKAVAQCCSDLVQGGFDDWRMPTVSELFTWAKPMSNAEYMTCPAYVKPGAGDPDNNFEYCTVTTYSAVTCAHRGQATTSGTFCVRGRGQSVPPITTETTCMAPCGLASENVYQACAP